MRNPEEQTITEVIALLHDQPFSVSRDITRNCRTLVRRAKNEGITFLTKVLPNLGKALDRALSGHTAFSVVGILAKSFDTCFPHFLGSALQRVFDRDGMLLPEPCYLTVTWLRTVCYYAYKIEVPFDEKLIEKFSKQFIDTDNSIGEVQFGQDTAALRNLMRHQLKGLTPGASKPSFGPGVSANCKRTDKYVQYVPPSDLRNVFGHEFFTLLSDPRFYAELVTIIWFSWFSALFELEPVPLPRFHPSKILFVPKDSRGPRVICCEDSRLMYAQKSLQKHLYAQIEQSSSFGGYVNFTDQTINQRLTFDKSNATLDLKDASDRISLDLVKDVFPPKLLRKMLACRSGFYVLPDESLGKMKKFAPMGSALCFPIMALVAYTAVTSAIYLAGGPVPNRNKEVFVYGDDIVVKNEYASIAILALESVGLTVNVSKSFVNSRFLESCGQDTLDQSSIVPLRKKRYLLKPKNVQYRGRRVLDDINGGYPHNVSLVNSASSKGFKNLARELLSNIESLYGKIPYGVPESPYACYHVSPEDVHCFNEAAGYEVNGKLRSALVVRDRVAEMQHTSHTRLLRNLLEGGQQCHSFEDLMRQKPFQATQIGARSTYLQKKSLQKWGTSYA